MVEANHSSGGFVDHRVLSVFSPKLKQDPRGNPRDQEGSLCHSFPRSLEGNYASIASSLEICHQLAMASLVEGLGAVGVGRHDPKSPPHLQQPKELPLSEGNLLLGSFKPPHHLL